MLARYSLAAEPVAAILHAIESHSFSQGIEPHILEVRVVRDAHRLDSLGAIGILRWAITSTQIRTPQTLLYHPTDPFAKQHEPDDRLYMLDLFYTKLLKLEESMATTTGRMLAKRRTDFMHSYPQELRADLGIEVAVY